jgi:hypothetical protein
MLKPIFIGLADYAAAGTDNAARAVPAVASVLRRVIRLVILLPPKMGSLTPYVFLLVG